MSGTELRTLMTAQATIEFFSGKSEKERKSFSAEAMQTLKTAIDKVVQNWSAPRDEAGLEAARVAVLASCGFTEIKKFGLDGLPQPHHCLAVLTDRKPSWLDKWMDFALQEAQYLYWPIVHQMEGAGLATAQRSSSYFLGMVLVREQGGNQSVPFFDQDLVEDVRGLLADTNTMKTILSPIWDQLNGRLRRSGNQLHKFFEIERSQWNIVMRVAPPLKAGLLKLAEQGLIEPAMLRDAAFEGLIRMTSDGPAVSSPSYMGIESPVTWWTTIIDALAQDSTLLIPKCIALLTSKDPQVICWSLEKLAACPMELLPLTDLYANVGTALSNKKKDPALITLKLMQHILNHCPSELESVAPIVTIGLEHASTDVQKRTIDFLEKTGAYKNASTASEMRYRSHSLKGLLKQRVDQLLLDSGALTEELQDNEQNYSAVDEENLLERAFQLPVELAEAAEVPAALEALQSEQPAPYGLKLDSMHIPRLCPENALAPVTELDDLIYLAIRVMQQQANSDEVEQLLDALSRLCSVQPEDFENRVSALRNEVRKHMQPNNDWAASQFTPFTGWFFVFDVTALIDSWITGKARQYTVPEDSTTPSELLLFLAKRMERINSRLARRQALPLLAAPTHKGGWIDGRVLAQRLSAYDSLGETPDLLDQVQCLLRIAPEFRKESLELLSDRQDEFHAALRFALGAEPGGPVVCPELWAAAWRCREPRGTSELLREKFGCYGPDAFTAATYQDYPDAIKYQTSTYSSNGVLPKLLKSFPPKIAKKSAYFPTVLLHEEFYAPWNGVGPVDLMWPALRESYLAFQTKILAQFIGSTGTYWQGSWDVLFDPDVPTIGNGAWLIALALCAKQKKAARLALDALICSIDDGRLDGRTFGKVIGRMANSQNTSMNRWMQSLDEAARISPMHSQFALDSIEGCIPHLYLPHKDRPPSVPMLELLHELCTKCGEAPKEESTATYLKAVPGKGKAASLAKMLLEMKPTEKAARHRQAVALQILDVRVQRAERWHRTLQNNGTLR